MGNIKNKKKRPITSIKPKQDKNSNPHVFKLFGFVRYFRY